MDRLLLLLPFVTFLLIGAAYYFFFTAPPILKNSKSAPALTSISRPVVGSIQFFTCRWDFFRQAISLSRSGNFSFRAGQFPIVGVSTPEARKVFFESRQLGFSEGYAALLGGATNLSEDGRTHTLVEDDHAELNSAAKGFGTYFNKRLVNMLKGDRIRKGLPMLLNDAKLGMDALAADPKGITDPFESIYRLVFQFTMRTVACWEIADDPVLMDEVLQLYETIEETATPFSIMYPWLLVPAKARRLYAGAKLYRTFGRVVNERRKTGTRYDDALQYLLDQGDGIKDIIGFVLAALFAGQLNSGINAAWMLLYLSATPDLLRRVREEVSSVAAQYCADNTAPLREQLMSIPADAWENSFPLLDACLKECIRLQMNGAAFRKNTSSRDVDIGKGEVIPPGAYVTFPVGVIHYSEQIYTRPDDWDPARFLPERAEDKKEPHAFVGWGSGRHPCLGMRFAKLEINILVAFWLANFRDFHAVDQHGRPTALPDVNRNRHTAHKPDREVWIKYST